MTPCSLQAALHESRRLGIRIQLDRRIPDLADHDVDLLLQALARHGVICIGSQPVSPRELQDFASRWGEVVVLPEGLALANQKLGLPSITRVGNIRPDGSIIPSVRRVLAPRRRLLGSRAELHRQFPEQRPGTRSGRQYGVTGFQTRLREARPFTEGRTGGRVHLRQGLRDQ
ncbi:MAG: hypothetical protein EXQ58_07120 [Acidobacteria bacterium]|nr:hypothetical protein [Acidobacteriota bacterium]